MPKIHIEEEYGYRDWYAELTDEEYAELLARWQTMKGLNCLVPVTLIVPQAVINDYIVYNKQIGNGGFRYEFMEGHLRCHIHECDDSYLDGIDYVIPDDENFWMDGKKYTDDELHDVKGKT